MSTQDQIDFFTARYRDLEAQYEDVIAAKDSVAAAGKRLSDLAIQLTEQMELYARAVRNLGGRIL